MRKLAQPKLIKKIGTVIEPMTEEALVSTAQRETDPAEEDDDKASGKQGKKMRDRRRQKSKPYNKPSKKK